MRASEALRREFSMIPTRRGRAFPEPLRRRAATFARSERAKGSSFAWIAETLGVSEETVRRWLSDRTRERRVLPVEVIDADEGAETVSSLVAVVSPKGYRVEGLRIDDAVRLLRELG